MIDTVRASPLLLLATPFPLSQPTKPVRCEVLRRSLQEHIPFDLTSCPINSIPIMSNADQKPELRIHEYTERGDNDTVKMPNGQTVVIDGKKCSDR